MWLNDAQPLRFAGVGRRERGARAAQLLESLNVGHCRDRIPARLSGGERQRTAIAVALANNPSVPLADEPTGELDSRSAETVISALRTANLAHGVTVLTVTHDAGIATQVTRTVAIRDGRTATETLRTGARHEMEEVEYAMVDRNGRLQLPREFTEPLGIRDPVRLSHEPGHVGVWPHHADRRASEPDAGEPDAGETPSGQDPVPGSEGD